MIKFIKNIFKSGKNKSDSIHSITCGEQDKDGFADTYVNGKKTNVRLLLCDKEDVEKLQKISEQIHKENGSK